MKSLLLVLALTGIMVVGCKKDNDGPDGDRDILKDSALMYAREIYLWYDQIPSSFNAQNYSDPNKIMEAIRQYSKEPGFTQPVDRWSFAMTKADWDDVSQGISGDFGIGAAFFKEDDLRISYAEKTSPAGKAGIQRGWRIKKVNNNSNVNTSNIDFLNQAIFGSTSSTFVFGRPSGTDTTITLTVATYKENPIVLDSVYTTNGTKTGYMAFNSFLGDTTQTKADFQRIFTNFSNKGVQDVIIDLRYNGGGYVILQDELANYLAPNAANTQVMETQQFNNKYAAEFNKTTRFKKKGSLNLNRVFVIVSNNTASASELLINSLKPFMNVQLIGPGATHGKPVGYFPIGVMDWYVFPVSFRTVNKNNEGNYFNGFSLNHQVMDGLDKAWGDADENCLGSVLRYIKTGSYARVQPRREETAGLTPEVENANNKLSHKFKGAVVVN